MSSMFNASIVLYHHKIDEISPLVLELSKAKDINEIFLIDNSSFVQNEFKELPVNYIFNGKNVGYGTGHNIAIRKTIEQNISYHLVLNPDIELEHTIFTDIVSFMQENKQVGHLMPKILYPNGKLQYQCKLLPTPFDLFIRRFLPDNWIKKAKDKFELRHSGYDKTMQIPCLSGCFMFLRTSTLKDIGIFDERFFMYGEDIDLTRRIYKKYKTIFYPNVNIIHKHERGSYKSFKLFLIHLQSIIKYFNKWNWIFDKERTKINQKTLSEIKKI